MAVNKKQRKSKDSEGMHADQNPAASAMAFPCQMHMLARATTGVTGWWKRTRGMAFRHTHIFSSAVLCQPRFSGSAGV